MSETVVCIACGTLLHNLMKEGHQPDDGLAFSSEGHYGSSVFDPMDGSYIEISVCDPCLSEAIQRGEVYFSNAPLNTRETV